MVRSRTSQTTAEQAPLDPDCRWQPPTLPKPPANHFGLVGVAEENHLAPRPRPPWPAPFPNPPPRPPNMKPAAPTPPVSPAFPCGNGALGVSLAHCSVSDPHGGGQRPLAIRQTPCRRWGSPPQRWLFGNELYHWENVAGPFLAHEYLAPRPPSFSNTFLVAPPPPLPLKGCCVPPSGK